MNARSRTRSAALVLVALAVLGCALATGASAAVYKGSTSATSTGGAGGRAVAGKVLFYDLVNTDENIAWPTPPQFKADGFCGYLQPYFNKGLKVSPSRVALCEQRVAANILGVSTSQIDPGGDAQCRLANKGPCWRNSYADDPHGTTSPPLVGRNGWAEMHNSGIEGQNAVSTAKTVIAWNVKIWRYNPRTGEGKGDLPIFERRVGLDGGAYTDDGLAPNCSGSDRSGCVSQDQWWKGSNAGKGAGYWWNDGSQAGPLGTLPSGNRANVCTSRWNAYRAQWPGNGDRPPSLSAYVGFAGANACFWTANDLHGRGYDPSTPYFVGQPGSATKDMESIALAWSLRTSTGQIHLKYKIVGRPGYLYAVLVTPVDNREQIVGPGQVQGQKPTVPGGYFRAYFADNPVASGGTICGRTLVNKVPGRVPASASDEQGISTKLTLSGGASQTTNSAGRSGNGLYCFTGLPAGKYSIEASVPAGTTARTPKPPKRTNITVTTGGNVSDQDFHFYIGTTPSGQPASIDAYAFIDENQNGRPDTGEQHLGGTTFALTGTGPDRSVPSASGDAGFSGLDAGTYAVTATPPGGYQATDDSDGAGNGRSKVSPLTLSKGGYASAWFGFYRPCPECSTTPDSVSGGYPAPEVNIAGPDTAITGRDNDYGLTVDWPSAGIGYDQALWPLSSRTVITDPQSGTTQEAPDGSSVTGFAFYNTLMKVKEASAPTGTPFSSVPSNPMTPCAALPAGQPCAGAGVTARNADLDVAYRRDEEGAFQNNAAVTTAIPFQIRDFDLAWLTPSLDPTLPATIGGQAAYQAGKLVQQVSDAAESKPFSWKDPQTRCADGAAAGTHCIAFDETLRPGNAVMPLSDMNSGRHQLAEAYQYHPFDSGFMSAHLATNAPDRVESLSVYDRGSDNGSRKGRIFADDQVAASQLGISVSDVQARRRAGTLRTREDAGGWNIYFCRSGGWDSTRVWNGKDLTFGSNTPQEIGDEGCRSEFFTFAWDATATDCRPTAPPKHANYLLNDKRLGAGSEIKGQMPWELAVRRCTFQNPGGYVQSGTWKPDWRFDLDNGCTAQNPANHRSPAGDPVPEARVIRCTYKSGSTTKNGWRPGHWFRGSWTYYWDGATCGRNKPGQPGEPAPPAGNKANYNDDGARSWVYNATQANPGASIVKPLARCTFADPTGYQWNGTWTQHAAEQGFGSPTGRLEAGEYTIVADYGPGAGSGTSWKITTSQYARKGSRWEWQPASAEAAAARPNDPASFQLTREASPVTTAVLTLQTTR